MNSIFALNAIIHYALINTIFKIRRRKEKCFPLDFINSKKSTFIRLIICDKILPLTSINLLLFQFQRSYLMKLGKDMKVKFFLAIINIWEVLSAKTLWNFKISTICQDYVKIRCLLVNMRSTKILRRRQWKISSVSIMVKVHELVCSSSWKKDIDIISNLYWE